MYTCNQKAPISLTQTFFYAGTLIISLGMFRPIASFFNCSDTFYLLSVFILVIRLLHEGKSLVRVFIFDNPFFKPLLVFIFGAILSLINTSDIIIAAAVVCKYIFLLGIWLPVGIYLINTSRCIKLMLIMLVIAAFLPLIPAICDYYFDTNITVSIDRLLEMNLEQTAPHNGRFGSIMGNPNSFGFMIVVVFPISLWLLFCRTTWCSKIFGLTFIFLLLLGSFAAASRSAVLAIFIQTLAFMVFMPNRTIKQKVAYLTFSITLFIGIIAIAVRAKPVIIADRFLEMATHELGEYEPDIERIDYMIEALQSIRAHPFAGIGVENAGWGVKAIGVHNTILRLWSSIGILGLIFAWWFYLLGFLTAFRTMKSAINAKSRFNASISFLMVVTLIGWFLVDMLQPQFYDRFKLVSLILVFSSSNVSISKSEEI